MLVEYADFISATNVSSVIDRSAFEMISRVIGSTVSFRLLMPWFMR